MAVLIASGGSVGVELDQRGAQAVHQHHLALGLAAERAARAEGLLHRRHRLPAERGKQPDGGLLDELVFGVGVGAHGSGRLHIDLAREQARQQQVAGAAEVLDLALQRMQVRANIGATRPSN